MHRPELPPMDIVKQYAALREAISARIVFGEPVEREGVTLIPAASVFGGGGLGSGEASPDGSTPAGGGGGYGVVAWPAGGFEIRGDQVSWHRAFDPTRFYVTALFVALWALKAILDARR